MCHFRFVCCGLKGNHALVVGLSGAVLCKLGMLFWLEWMMLSVCHPRETRDCFSVASVEGLFSGLRTKLRLVSCLVSA